MNVSYKSDGFDCSPFAGLQSLLASVDYHRCPSDSGHRQCFGSLIKFPDLPDLIASFEADPITALQGLYGLCTNTTSPDPTELFATPLFSSLSSFFLHSADSEALDLCLRLFVHFTQMDF